MLGWCKSKHVALSRLRRGSVTPTEYQATGLTEKNYRNREPIIGAHVMGTKRQGYWARKGLKH